MEFLFRERIYLLKSNNIIKLSFSFGVRNKGKWPLYKASCRHVPPGH